MTCREVCIALAATTLLLNAESSSQSNGWGWDYPSASKEVEDGSCEITLTTLNSTKYNLCPLKLFDSSQIPYYRVFDLRLNKTFAFNLLAPTIERPSACQSLPSSEAYLFGDSDSECVSLSEQTPVLSLLNEQNPAQGIVLSYESSATSTECSGHGQRLHLRFECDNENLVDIPSSLIGEVDSVGSAQCQFNLTFHSVFGCPHSCPIFNKKVCNAYGLCGYDTLDRNEPKCFCYSTIGGIACEIDPENHNTFNPSLPWPSADAYNDSSIAVHTFAVNKTAYDDTVHSMNVSFDMSAFVNIEKIEDIDGARYEYFVGRAPSDSVGCKNRSGAVFEVNPATKQCAVAGGWSIDWRLYDPSNAAKGATVTFGDGDVCEKDGTLRTFTVNLICPDDGTAYFPPNGSIRAFVEEDSLDSCSFHLDLVSAFACPKECRTAMGAEGGVGVCHSNGMCMADFFSGYVHCACDGRDHWTWKDDFCGEYEDTAPDGKGAAVTSQSTDSELSAVLAIVSVAFAMFCVLSGVMFFVQRKRLLALNASNGGANFEKPMLHEAVEIQQNDSDEVTPTKQYKL